MRYGSSQIKTGHNRGFSLVELLVVIAVIAILAAIMFPVFLHVKESARTRQCASNMNQLAKAIHAYMGDHDEHGLPAPPQNWKISWVLCPKPLLGRYIPGNEAIVRNEILPYDMDKNASPNWIWICPGDRNKGGSTVYSPYWWFVGSSYMYPGPMAYMSGDTIQQKTDIEPRKPTQWKKPARDMLLADFWYDFHHSGRVRHDFGDSAIVPTTVVNKSDVANINVIFLDLHAETVTLEERTELQKHVIYSDNPHFEGVIPKFP